MTPLPAIRLPGGGGGGGGGFWGREVIARVAAGEFLKFSERDSRSFILKNNTQKHIQVPDWLLFLLAVAATALIVSAGLD